MRLLVLVTDAFGGRGGIAKFNRDLLNALCAYPAATGVVSLPRLQPEPPGALPDKLTYRLEAARGKGAYVVALFKTLMQEGPFDGVVCGHINLLPLGYLAARWKSAPLLLIVHGIDAWQPTRSSLSNRLATKVDALVSVSAFTQQRFLAWTGLPAEKGFVVPDCIEADRFGPGPKRPDLLDRYGLHEKKVILTLGRLSAQEQYKGIDEVLDVLPGLAHEIPDIAYLVAGEGDDRPRLERKAARLGVQHRVVFTGYVPEEEKADHYRLADAFVMPGRGEGFGIVYLEAMACGLPVVASTADASREAVRNGQLGLVVDPDDPDDLRAGIQAALGRSERRVPEGLAYFSFERFVQRWHDMLDQIGDLKRVAKPVLHP